MLVYIATCISAFQVCLGVSLNATESLFLFYWLCYYGCPNYALLPPPHSTPFPPAIPPLSSYPWIMHISFLASLFSILFLTSHYLFCTYELCFLIPPPLPFLLPLYTLQMISIPMILFLFFIVCLVYFDVMSWIKELDQSTEGYSC